ncbi:MAG: class I SAM-dependent methyltransferase [Candidatus Nanopelagicales bacterium]
MQAGMIGSARAAIRTRIPFSAEAYEATRRLARRPGARRRVREVLASGRPVLLDLGGGYEPGRNGWLNIDISNEADIFWDLGGGIPFPDGTVDRVYSSHLFEHLTFDQGQALLAECLRVLKPGADISIAVPNARMYIEAYLGQRTLPEEYFGWQPAYNGTTPIDAVNYVAYMAGEHRYMFDQENLLHVLRLAGFEGVSERAMDPEVDRPERDFESIYAVGHKPGARTP